MIITQENLIKQIADQEGVKEETIRRVFKSAEHVIFNCLSATTASENTTVKVLDGLSLECRYVPAKRMHTYDDLVTEPKIWLKPKVTRYYNRKLNNKSNQKGW